MLLLSIDDEEKKFCNIDSKGHICNRLFSLWLTNGPNKLEFLSLAGLSNRVQCNTLAGNTKGGSITVLLTSCLTGLD
jgi:hypothetical protein